mmetsp:Transcript_52267/g.134862  ORF Transcript_52267/g.134862 Transcript_52267/m.134862 type:complete len:375 (+) Transcript_52267:312-1436(+)
MSSRIHPSCSMLIQERRRPTRSCSSSRTFSTRLARALSGMLPMRAACSSMLSSTSLRNRTLSSHSCIAATNSVSPRALSNWRAKPSSWSFRNLTTGSVMPLVFKKTLCMLLRVSRRFLMRSRSTRVSLMPRPVLCFSVSISARLSKSAARVCLFTSMNLMISCCLSSRCLLSALAFLGRLMSLREISSSWSPRCVACCVRTWICFRLPSCCWSQLSRLCSSLLSSRVALSRSRSRATMVCSRSLASMLVWEMSSSSACDCFSAALRTNSTRSLAMTSCSCRTATTRSRTRASSWARTAAAAFFGPITRQPVREIDIWSFRYRRPDQYCERSKARWGRLCVTRSSTTFALPRALAGSGSASKAFDTSPHCQMSAL